MINIVVVVLTVHGMLGNNFRKLTSQFLRVSVDQQLSVKQYTGLSIASFAHSTTSAQKLHRIPLSYLYLLTHPVICSIDNLGNPMTMCLEHS